MLEPNFVGLGASPNAAVIEVDVAPPELTDRTDAVPGFVAKYEREREMLVHLSSHAEQLDVVVG